MSTRGGTTHYEVVKERNSKEDHGGLENRQDYQLIILLIEGVFIVTASVTVTYNHGSI